MMIKEVKYVFDTGKKTAEFEMSKNQKGNTETAVTFLEQSQFRVISPLTYLIPILKCFRFGAT